MRRSERRSAGPRRNGGEPSQIYIRTARRRKRRRRGRRAGPVLVALVVVMLALAAVLFLAFRSDGREGRASSGEVAIVTTGGHLVAKSRVDQLRRLSPAGLARWLRHIPARRTRQRGLAVISYRTDRRALRRAVRSAIAGRGGTVRLPERAVAASARLPIVKQALRNNCETASLAMLLAAGRVKIGQRRLQAELPRSGPLDPALSGGLGVWGNPQKGFVGRAEGGGPSGGYGVYERPIRRLARRHGIALTDLTGSSPGRLYRALLKGRPLMAWVGLSDGPYKSWRTNRGRRITGNLNEHAVVLTGIGRGGIQLNDPLDGRRKRWNRGEFELMWRRLGRRALAI